MSNYIDPELNDKEHIKRIDRIAQSMLKADSQPAMRGWEEDVANLARSEASNISHITEEQFVRVFLPFFAADETNVYNVNISNWLTVAGGSGNAAFNRVNVFDPSTREVLFSVPPVYDNTAFTVGTHRAQDSVSEIVAETINISHINPRQGNQYFRERLSGILKNAGSGSVDVLSYIAEWNAIFKRYNRPIIELEGQENDKAKEQSSTTDTEGGFEDDYEAL